MSKVLFITPVHPDANGSGRQKRAHLWLSNLQMAGHEVHILHVQWDLAEGMTSVSERKHVLNVRFTFTEKLNQVLQFFTAFFTSEMAGISRFFWTPLATSQKAHLKSVYQNNDFDKIICFRLYLSEYAVYLKSLTGCPLMELDMDDIESSTWNSISRLLWKDKVFKRAVIHKLTSFHSLLNERRALKLFDSVYVCSTDDKGRLDKGSGNAEVKVLPNKIHGNPPEIPILGKPSRLLFIGSFGYYPNEEAILWFTKNVFPELRRLNPSITLNIAGFGCPERLVKYFSSLEGVFFFEGVSIIDEMYEQSNIVISPLHAGGGTKLKVLEAMWFGLPVVGTKESVRGLAVTANDHYLAADTKEEFIEQCLLLLQDEQIYKHLSIEARKLVAEKYCY
ncbi:glycosyltransferase [Desertivirga xinjiangensis]|uniref:glycosyltransferase n=1 Tax=Desertivirga xinjiangensis TaxID=539206 RepID=UPI00210CFE4C|nr:glycosyltransferase [Pedobacter xinjiangensis]